MTSKLGSVVTIQPAATFRYSDDFNPITLCDGDSLKVSDAEWVIVTENWYCRASREIERYERLPRIVRKWLER